MLPRRAPPDLRERSRTLHPQHKRLRERIWVLPVPGTLFPTPSMPPPSNPSSAKTSPASPSSPSEVAFLPTKLKAKKQYHAPPPPPSPKPPVVISTLERAGPRGPEVAVEIEFEQMWEASADECLRMGLRSKSQLGSGKRSAAHMDGSAVDGDPWALVEEDRVAMRRERDRCFVASPP